MKRILNRRIGDLYLCRYVFSTATWKYDLNTQQCIGDFLSRPFIRPAHKRMFMVYDENIASHIGGNKVFEFCDKQQSGEHVDATYES